MTIRNEFNVIHAELTKGIKLYLAYPIWFVSWFILPFLAVLTYVFQGKALIGGLESLPFQNLTGTSNYISWIFIGVIANTATFASLYAITFALRDEMYFGTLELILVTPARRGAILLGMTLSGVISSLFVAFAQTLVFTVFFGLKLTFLKIVPLTIISMLLVTALWGIGLGLSGLGLYIKEARNLFELIANFIYLFSPFTYPVEVNKITKTVSSFIPLTYALVLARGIMLLDKPPLTLWREAIILVLLDILLLFLGYKVFRYFERKTERAGMMAHY